MTVKELSQLYWLNKEIDLEKEKLKELEREACSATSPNLTSTSFGGAASGCGKPERYVLKIIELQTEIEKKYQQRIEERKRLEKWIGDIQDSLLRQIFTLRFIKGFTWAQVALHIGGGNTEAGVKMLCYRYLDKTGTTEK